MRNVTHANHQADYDAGYASKVAEIAAMGFEAAHGKFNLDNPVGTLAMPCKPSSLAAYYYTTGELEALVDNMPRK